MRSVLRTGEAYVIERLVMAGAILGSYEKLNCFCWFPKLIKVFAPVQVLYSGGIINTISWFDTEI